MSITIHADPVPLRLDEGGALRVGNTRVLFYLVIEAYNAGDAAETIVHKYSSLNLGDVYAVIASYLRHRQEMDDYLGRLEEEAAELRRKIEAEMPPRVSKEELLRRMAEREKSNVSPSR